MVAAWCCNWWRVAIPCLGVIAIVTPLDECFVCAIILLDEVLPHHHCASADKWLNSGHTVALCKV